MNFKKITLIALILSPLLFVNTLQAEALSKKELKAIKKSIGHHLAGNKAKKVFKKDARLAILGNSLVFRTEAKLSEETGWKDSRRNGHAKFAIYAKLAGIDDAVFQEITEEYNRMFIERVESLGLSIVPISELKASKSYAKLVDKNKAPSEQNRTNTKKNWGVSKTFTPATQIVISNKFAGPFSPQAKIPRELKAVLYNAFTHINFVQMNVDISKAKATEGIAFITTSVTRVGTGSILPAMNISEGTFANANGKKGLYNLRVFLPQDAQALNIMSNVDYSESTELCKSNCSLGFQSSSFFKESDIGLYTVNADPVKFKTAVLDLLSKYLDIAFTLYAEK